MNGFPSDTPAADTPAADTPPSDTGPGLVPLSDLIKGPLYDSLTSSVSENLDSDIYEMLALKEQAKTTEARIERLKARIVSNLGTLGVTHFESTSGRAEIRPGRNSRKCDYDKVLTIAGVLKTVNPGLGEQLAATITTEQAKPSLYVLPLK